MKKEQKIQFLILGMTTIFAGYILYLILKPPDIIEWFRFFGLLFFILLFSFIYIISLFFVALLVKYLKKDKKRIIFKSAKNSIFILIITIGIGAISGYIKVKKNETQMANELKLDQKRDSINYVKRLDSLTTIIQHNEFNYKAFVERGLMKRHKGEWEASISDYQKALRINPNYFFAHSEIAYSNKILKKFNQALFHYKKALEIDSSANWIKKEIRNIKEIKKTAGNTGNRCTTP